MIGHKARRARDGFTTRRCKAVTADGPCKMWTSFEYCHAHEWKMEQIVIGAHQSFVMEYPRVLAKLVSVMFTCPDPYIFLQSFDRFINHMKYISGDKAALSQQSTGFADLDTHQLIERATRAISALQQPPTAVVPELAPEHTPDGNSNSNGNGGSGYPPSGPPALDGAGPQQDALCAANGTPDLHAEGPQQTAADGPQTAPDGNA
jgi:hypothetical protein